MPHRPRPEEGTAGPLSASAALRGDPAANESYAHAYTPRPFRFSDDRGPHLEFRTEGWYFTGNLDGAEGRPFGYQLTFFQIGQSPKPVSPIPRGAPTPCIWRTSPSRTSPGVPSTTTNA